MCRSRTDQPDRDGGARTTAVLAGGLIVLALTVAFLCCFLGIHSRADIRAYHAMARGHFHPAWKDLALRHIRKGDSLESLRRYRPVRREDFGPYTQLYYAQRGLSGTLEVFAKDSRLIHARAHGHMGEHVFFGAPEEDEALRQAWTEHVHQRSLEVEAYRIHRAIAAGQDVFLSRRIKRSRVSCESEYSLELLEQMRKLYGPNYVNEYMRTRLELTVEVTEVLYGDLEPGTVLKFCGDNCQNAGLDGPETVFLHVEDSRILYSRSQGGETYATVPREALDWYQSLTADQIKELEARWGAR